MPKKEEIIIEESPQGVYLAEKLSPDFWNQGRIKYDGLFEWEGLYKLIYLWFVERGYYFEETFVKTKIPTPMGAENEYELKGWRKSTDYIKEWVRVKIHTFEMREVEVIKEGKKKKMVKARMFIDFYGNIEMDYQQRFAATQFGQYLRSFYDRLFLKKEFDSIWSDRLWYYIYKLHAEVKQYLDMQAKENAFYDVW